MDQNHDSVDDQLRVTFGAQLGVTIQKGDVVNVLFDCTTPNTFLQAANFSCDLFDTSDPDGNTIPGTNSCSVTLHVPAGP